MHVHALTLPSEQTLAQAHNLINKCRTPSRISLRVNFRLLRPLGDAAHEKLSHARILGSLQFKSIAIMRTGKQHMLTSRVQALLHAEPRDSPTARQMHNIELWFRGGMMPLLTLDEKEE